MKIKSIIVFILLISVLVCSLVACDSPEEPETPAEPAKIKLMNFNVRVQPGKTSDYRVKYDSVKDRAPLILKHIADANPDIICMQEWTGNHLLELRNELDKTYERKIFNRGDQYESLAILYKADRFEFVEQQIFWLSETPEKKSMGWDADCYRIYASVILRDKLTEKTFRVGTTHLDLNLQAMENGRNMVVDFTAESEIPALVCGDFNFNNKSAMYEYCVSKLDDCRTLAPNAVTTASYNGYNYPNNANHPDKVLDADNNVKDGFGYPIDQIFVTKSDFTVYSYDVLNYLIDGKFSSDHFPVVVEFSING